MNDEITCQVDGEYILFLIGYQYCHVGVAGSEPRGRKTRRKKHRYFFIYSLRRA